MKKLQSLCRRAQCTNHWDEFQGLRVENKPCLFCLLWGKLIQLQTAGMVPVSENSCDAWVREYIGSIWFASATYKMLHNSGCFSYFSINSCFGLRAEPGVRDNAHLSVLFLVCVYVMFLYNHSTHNYRQQAFLLFRVTFITH